MHLFVIPHWVNFSYLGATLLFALWRGDWAARTIAAGLCLSIFSEAYVCHTWTCFAPGQPPLPPWRVEVGFDILNLAICLACAWRARRYWILWATSFALLNVLIDLGAFVPNLSPWAYGSAGVVWTYSQATVVLIGVWLSPRGASAAAQARDG